MILARRGIGVTVDDREVRRLRDSPIASSDLLDFTFTFSSMPGPRKEEPRSLASLGMTTQSGRQQSV
jgi:hypothetical protein